MKHVSNVHFKTKILSSFSEKETASKLAHYCQQTSSQTP